MRLELRTTDFLKALACALVLVSMFAAGSARGQLPQSDTRAASLMDADHFDAALRIPPLGGREAWEVRRAELRQSVQLSLGLWPLPERNPLNAKVFDWKEGPGFKVAKVYFESLPGYMATGNLYLPAQGKGPFPAVLCPHGHWFYGRLNNSVDGSIPGRCMDFARMGFAVFSIDMVGYNDCFQLPHDENKSRAQLVADKPAPYEPRQWRGTFDFPEPGLYGMNLAGMQVWNAMRAVDFLSSLPEVDSTRIGCTGASGGASQTILLMTVDQRIKVAAPVNIIGMKKHPGCLCENSPGLWRDATTVELAAAFAPRPLILCSASEDPWTSQCPVREYPFIQKYYALYGAADSLANVHIQGGHNYNALTRAAVYAFFSKHLAAAGPVIEKPVPVAPELAGLGDLRVFPEHILPDTAREPERIIAGWVEASEGQFQAAVPAGRQDLDKFAGSYGKALGLLLSVESPQASALLESEPSSRKVAGLAVNSLRLGRSGKGDCIGLEVVEPPVKARGALVLVYPEEVGGVALPGDSGLRPWIAPLVQKGWRVVRVGGFASGELNIPRKTWESFSWPWAYNRGNGLEAIQDILTALAWARKSWPGEPLALAGLSRCGLSAAFAGAVSGAADMALIDLDRKDPVYDKELLDLLPVGSLQRVGGFRTAALLLARKPVVLLNPGASLDQGWFTGHASALGLGANLRFAAASAEGLWLPELMQGL
ncbi:acetylxylan esterase [bacterium]|nr:acetylxylan esterase [bacterium]